MLIPLTRPHALRSAYDEMATHIQNGAKRIERTVGHPGESNDRTVYWREDEQFWCVLDADKMPNSYQCLMGIEKPAHNSKLAILGEINIPKTFNRRIAGIFLKANDGLFLGHSGRLTISGHSVTQEQFVKWYANPVTVNWPKGKPSEVIMVGRVDNRLPERLAEFLRKVEQFKSKIREGSSIEE